MSESNVFRERVQAVADTLRASGIGALAVSPSSDFRYLTGVEIHLLERLVALVVERSGRAFLVAPGFEQSLLEGIDDDIDRLWWHDGQDPIEATAQAVHADNRAAVAFGADMPARFTVPLVAALQCERVALGDIVLGEARQIKSEDEIDAIRRAATATDAAISATLEHNLRGLTELDARALLATELHARGVNSDDGFCIIATGANAADPHHLSDDTVIGDGALLFDVGVPLDGYFTDTARTFSVGPPSADFTKIYSTVLQAQRSAIEAAVQGVAASSIDRTARSVIEEAGFGEYFTHRTGHGIGIDVHERPYLVQGDDSVLSIGSTFTVEPGIYVPGRFGVRIEDVVAITRDGPTVLTTLPKDRLQVLAW